MSDELSKNSKIAYSRHANVAEAFEIMANGLGIFVSTHMSRYLDDEQYWDQTASQKLGRPSEYSATDPLFQLLVLRRFWEPVFATFFGEDLRPVISELIEIRNKWAHFNLPDDLHLLDKAVLGIERILVPIAPDEAVEVRQVRFRLKNPSAEGSDQNLQIDVVTLERELAETQKIFEDLKKANTSLSDQLDKSKKISAKKQLRLSALENQLVVIQGKSLATERYIAAERQTFNRIEWLFVGVLAAIILILVVVNQ